MKVKSLAIALALPLSLAALSLLLSVSAPRAAAQSGTPISVGVYTCGTSYNYCYNVPVTIGGVQGTMWIDSPYFILFRAPLENATNPATVQITSVGNFVYQNGLIVQETIAFSGPADPNNDNDSDTVTGQITLNFSYQRRCGRGCYEYATIMGGSGSQSITQD